MKKIVQICLFMVLAVVLSFGTATAQKIGYTNSLALLSEMSAVKQANARLEAFEKQLSKQGEAMVTKLQNKFQDAQDKQRKGELTATQVAAIETELKQEQIEIQKFGVKAEEDLAKKRSELFAPILDKVTEAIKAVAEENDYAYIFDAGTNGILYAEETTDVTELVKAKLTL
ncbi:MAG: OmpH family outer membrane protein [Bacteroidota bacterium]